MAVFYDLSQDVTITETGNYQVSCLYNITSALVGGFLEISFDGNALVYQDLTGTVMGDTTVTETINVGSTGSKSFVFSVVNPNPNTGTPCDVQLDNVSVRKM